jgi:hypothetical protein
VPLETKERQLICQMFYCKETNVSLSNKEMFDERTGDVGCQAASTCHSVDGWSSSVVRGDLLRNSKVGSVRVSNPEIMQLAGEKSPAATKKFIPEIDADSTRSSSLRPSRTSRRFRLPSQAQRESIASEHYLDWVCSGTPAEGVHRKP